jgi:hypothetical protein
MNIEAIIKNPRCPGCIRSGDSCQTDVWISIGGTFVGIITDKVSARHYTKTHHCRSKRLALRCELLLMMLKPMFPRRYGGNGVTAPEMWDKESSESLYQPEELQSTFPSAIVMLLLHERPVSANLSVISSISLSTKPDEKIKC